METNRLRQFCVIYETKNLRKAADLLHMSHSALSKSMKVLQEQLGYPLLAPDGRGLVVTEEGRDFAQKARALLDFEKQILQTKWVAPEQFRIGSFESFSTHLLGMRWQKYFGDRGLQIHELASGALESAVAEGAIDVGITYEPVPTRELEFLPVGKVTLGVYHRRGYFKKLELARLPFVAPLLPSVGTPSSARGLDGWPEHEVPRNIRYRVDLMESGLALARAGRAAIFIPDFVARAQNEALAEEYRLVEREIPQRPKKIERRVYLIVKASRQKEKEVRRLLEMLKAECFT